MLLSLMNNRRVSYSLHFNFKLGSKKKFSGRLVVQAFFRIVVNPIFDKGDFFRSPFLSSLRQPSTNQPVVILISSPFPRGIRVCIVDVFLRKQIRPAVEFCSVICRDGKNVILSYLRLTDGYRLSNVWLL